MRPLSPRAGFPLPPLAARLMTRLASTSLALLLALAAAPLAAAPALNNVSPRGLQSGGTTTLTFAGGDLGGECRVIAAFPIAKQEVVAGANANQVQIAVTLDAAVPPGIYSVRLVHPRGISNPITIGIDPLPQQAFTAEAVTLPVALTGDLQGGNVLRTKFAGKKGQRVAIDVEGRRLGSNVRAVIRLYDPRGTQVAFSPPERRLFGDARCEATLAADGEYAVELHDLLYRGAAPGFFRVKIGDLAFADAAFPAAVTRNTRTALETAIGTRRPDPKVEVQVQQSGTHAPAPFVGIVGPLPRLAVSDEPEFMEPAVAPAEPPLTPPATVGLNGRIMAAGEEDRFRVPVLPGSKLRIEVQADRIGSPLDGVLSIRGKQGNQLAASDDQAGTTDPGLDFTVPQGVDEIVVAIKDMLGRGGPELFYHIDVVRDDLPDFDLAIEGDRVTIPAGGSTLLRVVALRDGYNGPIALSFPGLPAGVTVAGETIPSGASVALVTLAAPAGSSGAALFRVVGTSTETTPPRIREAEGPDSTAGQFQPWLRGELGAAIVPAPPVSVAWKTAAEETFTGTKLPIGVTLTRADLGAVNVRLTLVSTQPTPKKNVAQPPPKGRKKVPTPAKQEDDPDRMLRLEGAVIVTDGTNEGVAAVLVPGDLPSETWQMAVKAEFLAADGQVLATAFTPARTLKSVRSLTIELTGKPEVSAKASAGDTGKLTGKIVRGPGLTGPVTLTLANLPQGFMAPKLEIAADATEFTFPISFPAGTKQGDVPNVQLVGTMLQIPGEPRSTLTSNGVPIALKVVP